MNTLTRRDFLKFSALTGAAAAAGLALAGCAKGGETGGETGTTTGGTTTGGTTTGGEGGSVPAGDGWFDMNDGGLSTLTPFVTNGGRDHPHWKMFYERLAVMTYERELAPLIASDWSTEDNLTYNINIKENITDSEGNHITADDIVWFINKSRDLALKPVFNKITDCQKTGDFSLSVTIAYNMIGVFEYIMEDSWAVSRTAFEASPDEFGTTYVSTSPYVVTEFVPSGDFKLEVRDDYWQPIEDMPKEVRPMVQKIYGHYIAETAQVGIALETGLIDFAWQPAASIAVPLFENPSFTIEEYEGHQGYQLFFSGHETRPVAKDVKLCNAIAYAIDNQGLIDAFAYGHGTLLYDVCPPFYIGYDKDWEKEDYFSYNPEKAKQLVAESNYQGQKLVLLCNSAFSRVGEIIQSCLLAVGINMEIYSPESALLMAIRFDGSQYDMFINSIGGTYLPDHWSIRYDPNAYSTGDGTARKDYVLGELLYKTWTVEGYTKENIDAVHDYIRDNGIAYGLFNNNRFIIYSNKIKLVENVLGFNWMPAYFACTWEGI